MSPPGKIIERIGDCWIYKPASGGKAGHGFNKTSALQIRRADCIVKYIRYNVGEAGALEKAIEKAREYIKTPGRIDWVQL